MIIYSTIKLIYNSHYKERGIHMVYKIDIKSIIKVKLITKSTHIKIFSTYLFFPLLCLVVAVIKSIVDPNGTSIIYYIIPFVSLVLLIKPIKDYLRDKKLMKEGPLYYVTYKYPSSSVEKVSEYVRGDVIGLPTSYKALTKAQYESLSKGYKR